MLMKLYEVFSHLQMPSQEGITIWNPKIIHLQFLNRNQWKPYELHPYLLDYDG